jgi:hypothetical protein
MELHVERVLQTTRQYFATDYDALPPHSTERSRRAALKRLRDATQWVAEFAHRRKRQRERRIARTRPWAAA